ncbi:MAG: hypothetical protein AB7G23_03030 [Vicinamibacterales bacterium]
MSTRLEQRVVAKTADYAISPAKGDNPGQVFTNAGASGAVVFTLPTPTRALLGFWYDFLGVADQSITVAAATADTLITKNDVAADSIALSTSGEKIGGHIRVTCVKTGSTTYQWLAVGLSVGHTFTVVTA